MTIKRQSVPVPNVNIRFFQRFLQRSTIGWVWAAFRSSWAYPGWNHLSRQTIPQHTYHMTSPAQLSLRRVDINRWQRESLWGSSEVVIRVFGEAVRSNTNIRHCIITYVIWVTRKHTLLTLSCTYWDPSSEFRIEPKAFIASKILASTSLSLVTPLPLKLPRYLKWSTIGI